MKYLRFVDMQETFRNVDWEKRFEILIHLGQQSWIKELVTFKHKVVIIISVEERERRQRE